MRVLILGGTTEANALATALVQAEIEAVYSYAGRTKAPLAQPLPTRSGGFGGVAGLAGYIRGERITHVVDATHPFAAQISANAVAACASTETPLIALQRPAWTADSGDHWTHVADLGTAVAALPVEPARVFLAIGKQGLAAFARRPQHFYLLRLVDAAGALPLPDALAVIARGPFTVAGDTALLRQHRITHLVAKNAGGTGAEAKLIAARALGLPVILIDRPTQPDRLTLDSVQAVMRALSHARLGV